MNFFFFYHTREDFDEDDDDDDDRQGASVYAQSHRTCVLHRLSCAVNDLCEAPGLEAQTLCSVYRTLCYVGYYNCTQNVSIQCGHCYTTDY